MKQIIHDKIDNESGATLVLVMTWLLIVVVLTALTARLAPVYYDSLSVDSIIHDECKIAVSRDQTLQEMQYGLTSRLAVARIHIPEKDITIHAPTSGHASIRIVYSKIVPLMYHASLLIQFNKYSKVS